MHEWLQARELEETVVELVNIGAPRAPRVPPDDVTKLIQESEQKGFVFPVLHVYLERNGTYYLFPFEPNSPERQENWRNYLLYHYARISMAEIVRHENSEREKVRAAFDIWFTEQQNALLKTKAPGRGAFLDDNQIERAEAEQAARREAVAAARRQVRNEDRVAF